MPETGETCCSSPASFLLNRVLLRVLLCVFHGISAATSIVFVLAGRGAEGAGFDAFMVISVVGALNSFSWLMVYCCYRTYRRSVTLKCGDSGCASVNAEFWLDLIIGFLSSLVAIQQGYWFRACGANESKFASGTTFANYCVNVIFAQASLVFGYVSMIAYILMLVSDFKVCFGGSAAPASTLAAPGVPLRSPAAGKNPSPAPAEIAIPSPKPVEPRKPVWPPPEA